jgi:hypothetical protein
VVARVSADGGAPPECFTCEMSEEAAAIDEAAPSMAFAHMRVHTHRHTDTRRPTQRSHWPRVVWLCVRARACVGVCACVITEDTLAMKTSVAEGGGAGAALGSTPNASWTAVCCAQTQQ